MKQTYVFLLIMFIAIATGSLFATNLLTDDFTGTVGTNLTANGWTAHSGTGVGPMTITTPGLEYLGYAGSGIGDATSPSGNSEDVNKAFTSTTSGSVYYAFLVNTAITTTTTGYSLHFCQTSGATASNFYGRFWLVNSAGNVNFGLSKFNNVPVYAPTSYALNTTYLVIIKYTFNSGSGTDDAVYMWVNPTLGGPEPTPTVSVDAEGTADATGLTALAIRQWNTGTLARIDGIRVGTDWSDVAGASLATEPSAQPTGLGFNTITSTSYNVTFTAASPAADNYLVVRKEGSAPTSDPVDGAAYVAGNTLGDGIIAYSGSGTSFPETTLIPGTTYYYKIYSYNGTAGASNYLITSPLAGSQATLPGVILPSVTTASVTAIGVTSATGGGEVLTDGGGTVDARGVCWNTTGTPTISDPSTTDGSGTGIFASTLTPLNANQMYYVRAYAHNAAGYAYGDEVTFTTLRTEPAAHVTSFAAGTVTAYAIPLTWVDAVADGYIIKGSDIGYGNIADPVDGVVEANSALAQNVASGVQAFEFGGLNPSTTYYFKIYPYNNNGTDINYKTDGTVPEASATTDAAVATILMTEDFDYTVGTLLTDNGWTAHSGAGTASPLVDATNLTYPGYIANAGGSGRTTGVTGEDVNKVYTAQTAGNIYCAFLMNITAVPNTTQDYCFHLGTDPIGTNFRGRLYVQRDASNNIRFGISKYTTNTTQIQWTGGLFTGGTFDYALNTTYLMVIKYSIIAGDANDEVSLFVNPVISPVEPLPTLFIDGSIDTGSDPANIGSVAIRQSSNTPAAYYDGIRIATGWDLLFSSPYTGEIAVTESLTPFDTVLPNPSVYQTYHVTGVDLASFIDVNVTGPFEVRDTMHPSPTWETYLQLAPDYDGDIDVRYVPTVEGNDVGSIIHSVDGGEAATVVVNLSGTATSPLPGLTVDPTVMSFSANNGETSAAQMATVTAANLVTGITVASTGEYTFSATEGGTYSNPYVISTGYNGANDFYIKFSPTSIGTFTDTITLTSGTASDLINVTGYGLDPSGTYAVDLFFSEYIEGSSNNKALEIFNGTGHAVDLSDYIVQLYSNGSATPGNTLSMTGSLADGEVYVIANSSAIQAILDASDITSTVTYFNGDDAVALYKVSTDSFVDIFGVIGADPGTQWTGDGGYTTLNATLVRKPTVEGGITVNPTASIPPLPTDFTTLTTEWDLYAIDYISDLGSHLFTPGLTIAEAPVIYPAEGIQLAPINVSMSSTTPGAVIWYTLDGTDPTDAAPSIQYSASFAVSTTTTVKARTYAVGYAPSSISSAQYIFPTEIADIATLRAQTAGTGDYFKLTGEAVLTLKTASRNAKYIQDTTGAVLVDDPLGNISTTYNLGDGITGIVGTLGTYANMLQFTPASDPGIATSIGNVVTPEDVTLTALDPTYQGKLVKLSGVTFAVTGTFASSTNYDVNDASGAGILRTAYYDLDYVGTAIPETPKNIVGVVLEYNAVMQFVPRSLAEFTDASAVPDAPINLVITAVGNDVLITWDNDPAVTSWTIWSSDDPAAGYTLRDTVFSNSCTLTGDASTYPKRFYYVVANN